MSGSEDGIWLSRRVRLISSSVAVISGVLAVAIAAVSAFTGDLFVRQETATGDVLAEVRSLRERLDRAQGSIDDLKGKLEVVTSSIANLPDDVESALLIGEIRGEIEVLRDDLEVIEAGLLDSPTKALSIPLLRKDIEALAASYRDDLQTTRGEIARIYDLNKWFIGLMATMAIGILGLAVGNLYQAKK